MVNPDKEMVDEYTPSFGETQPDITLVKSQSSVQIETDSKGIKKYSVKVYADNAMEAANKALEISEMVEQRINKKED
ncbi:MAG: hypothetical protein K0Q47_118 [Sedimentibacter sp.]|nr:hypothetical protein [Sedimentibacter sp.]